MGVQCQQMKLSEKDAKDVSKTGDQLSVCSARSLLPNANTDAETDKSTEMLRKWEVRSVTDVG